MACRPWRRGTRCCRERCSRVGARDHPRRARSTCTGHDRGFRLQAGRAGVRRGVRRRCPDDAAMVAHDQLRHRELAVTCDRRRARDRNLPGDRREPWVSTGRRREPVTLVQLCRRRRAATGRPSEDVHELPGTRLDEQQHDDDGSSAARHDVPAAGRSPARSRCAARDLETDGVGACARSNDRRTAPCRAAVTGATGARAGIWGAERADVVRARLPSRCDASRRGAHRIHRQRRRARLRIVHRRDRDGARSDVLRLASPVVHPGGAAGVAVGRRERERKGNESRMRRLRFGIGAPDMPES